MNVLSRSLLIGIAVTTLVFFLNRLVIGAKRQPLFTIHYTVLVIADEKISHGEHVDALIKLPGIIKRRCKAAGYSPVITGMTERDELRIDIEHVDDTAYAASLITRNSKLEFREMYTLIELPSLTGIFKEQPGRQFAPDVIVPSDSTKSLRIGEPTPEKNDKGYILDTLVRFNNTDGQSRFAELGTLYKKDTSIVNNLLRQKSTLEKLPLGIRFYYGGGDHETKRNRLLIYAIRTEGQEIPLLQNRDIKSAMLDFDPTGRPMVSISFTTIGARIWAYMTRKNVDRPIAIIMDNHVISAPFVTAPIESGNTTLSGDFWLSETEMLASQLNSGYIPLKLNISHQEVIRENSGFAGRTMLIMVGVFVISSALSWFIFNILKNRETPTKREAPTL